MRPFFDTNILVYAYSSDSKRAKAQEAMSGGGIISAQVLNEFTNVLRKKQRQEWPVIEQAVATLRGLFTDIRPLTGGTHASALALARSHGLSFHEALIIASAQQADCDTLFSEGMQQGRRFGALTVANPFSG